METPQNKPSELLNPLEFPVLLHFHIFLGGGGGGGRVRYILSSPYYPHETDNNMDY